MPKEFQWDFQGPPIMGPPYGKLPILLPYHSHKSFTLLLFSKLRLTSRSLPKALDVDVPTALRWVAIATVSLLAVIFPLIAQRLTFLKAPTTEISVDLTMKRLDFSIEFA